MTRPDPLSAAEKRLLVRLADPQAGPPDPRQVVAIDAERLAAIVTHHSVAAIARRKLQTIRTSLPPAHQAKLDEGIAVDEIATVVTLDLEARAEAITRAFLQEGIDFALVKGPVFAGDLYDDPVLRPFTDIDLLMDPDHLDAAGAALQGLGYKQSLRERFDQSVNNREEKWIVPDKHWVLVELHGDLVHHPALRRRIRYDLAAHRTAGGWSDRTGRFTYPHAGHFALAAVHAAAGHKFHALRLIVDALQAARCLSAEDTEHLAAAAVDLRLRPELAQTLHLAHSLFPDRAGETPLAGLAERLKLPRPSKLVRPDDVLNTFSDAGHRSRMRRHLFRHRQILAPR